MHVIHTKPVLFSIIVTALCLSSCGDEEKTPPALACNVATPTDVGIAELCVEFRCTGVGCEAGLTAVGCGALVVEGSDTTVQPVASCPGDSCHSSVSESPDGVEITTDYYSLNEPGSLLCFAIATQ